MSSFTHLPELSSGTAIIATVVTAALCVAVFTDLREQRIPNLLTGPLLAAGLLFHALTPWGQGWLFGLAGFGLGFGLMLVPFLMGCMGGGDVKLFAALGAWLGASDAFTAFLLTCLAGGAYTLLLLATRRGLARTVGLALYRAVWLSLLHRRAEFTPAEHAQDGAAVPRLCYGVAIAAGTLGLFALRFAEISL